MKSLFKKITGSRQLSPTTTPPPTKTRSSSQTSAIDDHQIIPLTANEVRTIMVCMYPDVTVQDQPICEILVVAWKFHCRLRLVLLMH